MRDTNALLHDCDVRLIVMLLTDTDLFQRDLSQPESTRVMTISQDHGRCRYTGSNTYDRIKAVSADVHRDGLAVTVGDIGCAFPHTPSNQAGLAALLDRGSSSNVLRFALTLSINQEPNIFPQLQFLKLARNILSPTS